jgi:hypothetical protein
MRDCGASSKERVRHQSRIRARASSRRPRCSAPRRRRWPLRPSRAPDRRTGPGRRPGRRQSGPRPFRSAARRDSARGQPARAVWAWAQFGVGQLLARGVDQGPLDKLARRWVAHLRNRRLGAEDVAGAGGGEALPEQGRVLIIQHAALIGRAVTRHGLGHGRIGNRLARRQDPAGSAQARRGPQPDWSRS